MLQLQKIVAKILNANDINKSEPEILASLSTLLCKMESNVRRKLLSSSIDNSLAINVLGNINYCSNECIEDLAEFVMNCENYGVPETWDSYDMISLGIIPAGNILVM